jgi:hypothetical protein
MGKRVNVDGMVFSETKKVLSLPVDWISENKPREGNYTFFGKVCKDDAEGAVMSNYRTSLGDPIWILPIETEHLSTSMGLGEPTSKFTPVYLKRNGLTYLAKKAPVSTAL